MSQWASSKVRDTMAHWHIWDVMYVIIVFFADSLWLEKVHPYERQFTINDITISHPIAHHERVPGGALVSWSMFLPPVVIAIVVLLFTPAKYKIYVMYIANLSYYTAIFTTVMITDVLKNWIGRCRPDFLERCKPLPSAVPDVLYFAKDICSTYNPGGPGWGALMDGFRTTPSGHSSMAFTVGGFLTLFFLSQLNTLKPKYSIWRFIFATSPLYGSFYVALSRTQDYRHHFVDVFLGSLLGSVVVFGVYSRFWPAINSPHPYVPTQLLESEVLDEEDWFEMAERAKYLPTSIHSADLENQYPSSTATTTSPFQ